MIAGGPEKKLQTLSVMCENFKYPESSGSMYGPSWISRNLRPVKVYSRIQSRK